MSRILTIDIGAGTMDVLYTDTVSGEQYKAVVKSPVKSIAERVRETEGKLVVIGNEMGGGPITRVLKERAGKTDVAITGPAAATISHNIERVLSYGLRIVDLETAEELCNRDDYSVVKICDLEIDRLVRIIHGFGVPFSFDIVGVCAQDHGIPPEGMSHLDYRHSHFKSALDKLPFPHSLLYKGEMVPVSLNRLRSIAESARMLPADEVYVMDSGMAAILGASMDPRVADKKAIVLDIATSHTVGATVIEGEIFGFFEYHTKDITPERLEKLIQDLADGKIQHEQIISEGGHGAYVRRSFGFENADLILATGPLRKLIKKSHLPIIPGAPLGDNMMTGTSGLLEAIRRAKGMDEISCAD